MPFLKVEVAVWDFALNTLACNAPTTYVDVPDPSISREPAMVELAVVEVATSTEAESMFRAVRLVTVEVAVLEVRLRIVASTAWRLVVVPVTVLVMPPVEVTYSPFEV